MADITALRNRRAQNIANIAKTISEQGQKQSYEDDRYWKLEAGKDGNGAALIRFLDVTPDCDDIAPYVQIWKYSFKVNGRWYIEKSLKSIGQDDPVYDLNGRLWQEAKGDKKHPSALQAKRHNRQLKYHSNILVINDQKNPDNNGKVFLFEYGPQIFGKINSKIAPSEEEKAVGAVSMPVFDYWEGHNFRLIIKSEEKDFGDGQGKKQVPNYDNSSFDEKPTAIAATDEEIVAIASKQYSLAELLDPKHFKTYDALKKRLDWVYGGDTGPSESGDEGKDEPAPPKRKVQPPKRQAPREDEGGEDPQGESEATEYLRSLMES